MCECLCGNIKGDEVFQVNPGDTVCLDVYAGCAECDELIGIDIRVFNEAGRKEWLYEREPQVIKGDEYGVVPTAISRELFSIEDIATVLDRDLASMRGYSTMGDWFREHGLSLIQDAMSLANQRRATRVREANS